jgi:transketolase
VRNAFTSALIAAAKADSHLILLTGDHGNALFEEFRGVCPGQFVNAGIAEQNMIGVAAGLAKSGFRPLVYALSSFSPIRVLEQIKLDVCCDELPVLLIGDGAGVVYGTLGVTHQTTEDIAALRALPHMRILSPADAHEMTAAMALALATPKPIYLRMGKSDLGPVHNATPQLEWGRLLPVSTGDGPLVFVATGSQVNLAVKLAQEWPGSAVWSAPCLKPLDPDSLVSACNRHRLVITMEEHNIVGGLGGAVAEILSQEHPMPVCRLGIRDRFTRLCGSYDYTTREHGLDLDSARSRINAFKTNFPLKRVL